MTIAIERDTRVDVTRRTVRAVTSTVTPLGLTVDTPPGSVWDETVWRFDGACQEQTFAYARGRWPALRLEPVLFRRNGQAIGGALVMLQPLPLKLGTIALVKWGPILAGAGAPDADALMRDMIGYLKAEYGERRGMMVSIMPMVEPEADNRGLARLLDMGFTLGERLRAPDRYVVDVQLNDDARMAAFAQKWRYHLRKAMKNDLTFERADGAELDRFMVIYNAMTERKRFADHSAIGTVADLFSLPEGQGRPELFFVSHEGQTVAGAIIFTAGKTATYLYGATNDAALDLRAGYFLHWNIIRWLRDNTRAEWYDLGGTDGSHGLHQFKSGMVGDAGYINPLPPVANYAASIKIKLAGELAYAVRGGINRVRDTLNEMLRNIQKRAQPRSSR